MRLIQRQSRSHRRGNEHGVSLIAAIFIVIVLAVMGTAFVSLIGSSSLSAVDNVRSEQALAIAEGGVEFEQLSLSKNLDWYRSSSDPLANDARSLGAGSFVATARVPATMLRRTLHAGDATAAVSTTDGFPLNGYLQIGDDIASDAEFVQYSVLNATKFTLTARGGTVGTVGTIARAFPRGTYVYPVAQLAGGLPNSCTFPTSITIAANAKFLGAGTIDIEGEEITYSGSATSGGVMTLTGITRCLVTASAAHAALQPVTPLLVGGASADMQSEITATGAAGPAQRVVRKTVQR